MTQTVGYCRKGAGSVLWICRFLPVARARQQNFEGWLKKSETGPDGFTAGIDAAEFVFRGASCALVDELALLVLVAHRRAALASSMLSPHSLVLWRPARAGAECIGGV